MNFFTGHTGSPPFCINPRDQQTKTMRWNRNGDSVGLAVRATPITLGSHLIHCWNCLHFCLKSNDKMDAESFWRPKLEYFTAQVDVGLRDKAYERCRKCLLESQACLCTRAAAKSLKRESGEWYKTFDMRWTAGFEPAAKTLSHRGERREREEGEVVNKEKRPPLFGNAKIIAVIKNKSSIISLKRSLRNLNFRVA